MKISTLLAARSTGADEPDALDPTTTAERKAHVPAADPVLGTATAMAEDPPDGTADNGAETGTCVDTDDPITPIEVGGRRRSTKRLVAFVLLPLVAMVTAGACGYLKWQTQTGQDTTAAAVDSVRAAKDSTVALLSYAPDTAERQLSAAGDLLTGTFRDSYTSLINDVVIPSAHQKQISVTATVPAVASVSAGPRHAVAMVFVDQTTFVGSSAPTATSSVVRVTLDKIDGRWLVSAFDPI